LNKSIRFNSILLETQPEPDKLAIHVKHDSSKTRNTTNYINYN